MSEVINDVVSVEQLSVITEQWVKELNALANIATITTHQVAIEFFVLQANGDKQCYQKEYHYTITPLPLTQIELYNGLKEMLVEAFEEYQLASDKDKGDFDIELMKHLQQVLEQPFELESVQECLVDFRERFNQVILEDIQKEYIEIFRDATSYGSNQVYFTKFDVTVLGLDNHHREVSKKYQLSV